MKRVIIIHFNPIELYPPIQNLLNNISFSPNHFEVYVITTAPLKKEFSRFESPNSGVKILRLGNSGVGMIALKRYWNFILFYLGCLYYLIKKNPGNILYYETLSSFPAYMYKKYFNKKVSIFIHYHEYTSFEEHIGGTRLLQYFHRCENYLYPIAKWVSHTNKYRMNKFIDDIQPVQILNSKIFPNYPPKKWLTAPRLNIGRPIRIIYVGAISMQTMYTRKFSNFVKDQGGQVTWDIYSYNLDEEVRLFLDQLNCEFIHIKGAVNYDQLSDILPRYDVGVILYTGHIPNYVYNAPNKLFEYAVCGLDVWFPKEMTGSLPYLTNNTYPKVVALDFKNLQYFDIGKLIDRNNMHLQPINLFCEDACRELNLNLFQ